MHVGQRDCNSLFQRAMDSSVRLISSRLEINECQQTSLKFFRRSIQHSSGIERMNAAKPRSQNIANQDRPAQNQNHRQQNRASPRSETTINDPVIQQRERQNISNQQQAGENASGEQIGGLDTSANFLKLILDEFISVRVGMLSLI